MLVATRVKMSGSQKKVSRTTYNISSIKRLTRKFLEVSRCRRAKQRQRNVQKKCTASCFFANQTFFFFFAVFVAVAAGLALPDFIFCFSKLQILTRASLLALAKSIYDWKIEEDLCGGGIKPVILHINPLKPKDLLACKTRLRNN